MSRAAGEASFLNWTSRLKFWEVEPKVEMEKFVFFQTYFFKPLSEWLTDQFDYAGHDGDTYELRNAFPQSSGLVSEFWISINLKSCFFVLYIAIRLRQKRICYSEIPKTLWSDSIACMKKFLKNKLFTSFESRHKVWKIRNSVGNFQKFLTLQDWTWNHFFKVF